MKKPSTTIYKSSLESAREQQELIDKTITWAEIKYGEAIGEGLDRIVFDAGEEVVKIPKHSAGIAANYSEEYKYQRWEDQGIYAKCWIKEINQGIPILFMEKVDPITEYEDLPDWVDFIDCRQVGYTADNRLVAYDYASH